MNTWPIDPDTALALPVDELGLLILRDYGHSKGMERLQLDERRTAGARVPEPSGRLACTLRGAVVAPRPGLVARDFGQSNSDSVFITRVGERALEEGLAEVRAIERLQVELHPVLEAKVRHMYLVGDYDTAVFKAFKQVEVRVRKLSQAASSLVGVQLMQHAFGIKGPSATPGLDKGEQVARMDLFKGAIGF